MFFPYLSCVERRKRNVQSTRSWKLNWLTPGQFERAPSVAEQPQILSHGRLFRRRQLDGLRRGARTLAFSPLRRVRRSSAAPLALPIAASIDITNASAAKVREMVGKTANGKKRTLHNLRLRSRYRGLFAPLRSGRYRHRICSVRRAARLGECVRLTDRCLCQ